MMMPRHTLIPSWLPLATIALALASRLLPHPWNLTPVGAMFLFCGFTAASGLGLALPLITYVLSDIVLDGLVYHVPLGAGAGWVWLGFTLVWCIGRLLRHCRRFVAVYPAAIASSLAFFLVSNFGEWLGGALYPHTTVGLAAAYIAGLPFLQTTLVGDLGYSTVFFAAAVALEFLAERRRHPHAIGM